jgi:uncharacterized protein with HEPN domain
MKNDVVYLKHILDAINQLQGYVGGMTYEAFRSNRLVQDGVIRQFEIIGEATKNLSTVLRSAHNEIPWKDLAGMRDKLIHQYFGVDLGAVWASIESDIPMLRKSVEEILKSGGD